MIARAHRTAAATLIAFAIGAVAPACAQDLEAVNYPNRPIHIIVPFPAGGPTDILSRIVGQEMTASWGQPVVIENRPGADSTIVLNPLVKKDLPYDPFRDFQPISLGAKNISLFEVRADSELHNVKDLL